MEQGPGRGAVPGLPKVIDLVLRADQEFQTAKRQLLG